MIKGITSQYKVNNEIYRFYRKLFKQNIFKTKTEMSSFLDELPLPSLSLEENMFYDTEIQEQDLCLFSKGVENNKSTGNDGLTKEFHEIFWNEISEPLLKSVQYAKSNQHLNFFQRQAIIKLLEKKIEIKDIKQNWRHISLFNANTKI